jgi:GTP-binding protein HflX
LKEPERTELSVRRERAVLVGVLLPGAQTDLRDPLAELRSLARTAGAHVVDHVLQKRTRTDSTLFVGRGKAEEIARRVQDSDADVVIFDNDLTPAQVRDLEKLLNCKIVDRSELILDIFATRARTRQARLQVELAQLEYTAPRLRGMWRHLERIAGAGGGTGAGVVGGIGTRGPGERQIEIDRRIVSKRVSHLREQLARIDQRKLREVRSRKDQFKVALVGYTNAGKSTLMNALTGANAFVEDKLFATLDTKTRKWWLDGGELALLSDTVGFVRDLPHHLVASFRATLEEVIYADLLLHVVDASSPIADHQFCAVRQVLEELGCQDKPELTLLNKMDAVDDYSVLPLVEQLARDPIRISAINREGLDEVVGRVGRIMRSGQVDIRLRTSAGHGRLLAFLAAEADVADRRFLGELVEVTFRIHRDKLSRLREFNGSFEALDAESDDMLRIQE